MEDNDLWDLALAAVLETYGHLSVDVSDGCRTTDGRIMIDSQSRVHYRMHRFTLNEIINKFVNNAPLRRGL